MSAGLRGNTSSLKDFAKRLRTVPRIVAHRVAEQAAPAISAAALTTFDAGQDPYGHAWLPGVDGTPVTLVQTGRLRRTVRYVAIGAKLRVALGVPYARYQIGKRPVFPRQGGALPPAYSKTLAEVTAAVIRKELGR